MNATFQTSVFGGLKARYLDDPPEEIRERLAAIEIATYGTPAL